MNAKRLGAVCLLIALLFALASPAALAEERMIHITTAEQLQQLARDCVLDSYSVGLNVVLDQDLDLGGVEFEPIPTFSGTFDGRGHTIFGLAIQREGSHLGFFRYIQAEGVVRNLSLSGTVAPGDGQHQIGGVAGTNRGLIENCSFSGSVSGLRYVGGIAGENEGTIRSCTFSGSVDAKRATGGIAGSNSGVLLDCESRATVNTTISEAALDLESLSLSGDGMLDLTNAEDENVVSDTGGIVGLSTGTVSGCVNRGMVGYPRFGYNVGGIAGRQSGYLTSCRNFGDVHGRKDVGGIVGQMEPYLLLLESVNLAEELELLNAYMDIASGDLGLMSNEMNDTLDSIQASSDSASGKIDGSGTISRPGGGGSQRVGATPVRGQDESIEIPEDVSGDISDMADGANQMAGIVATSSGYIAQDLGNVNDQLSRVLMLLANALNGAANRQIYQDGSEEMEEEDLLGRVSLNTNSAIVSGDTNVGGIAGDMGIEYEFDLDGQLAETIGIEGIVSNTYETHCVGEMNVNEGVVEGRKDGVGGIAGKMELGLVSACESYGAVSSPDGSYVGGIAGYSYASIRDSYAMCDVLGSNYVGGVAGYGTRISGCGSMAGIDGDAACSGTIAGYADVDAEDAVVDNVYVHDGLGAVDGISYSGRAEPVSYEQLLEREGLPERFRTLRLRFVADGRQVAELKFGYGGSVDESKIPAVPEKEGYTGSWPAFERENLTRSAVIEAVYTPRQGALASEQTRGESPMSIVLVEGDFTHRAEVRLSEYGGEGPVVEDGVVLEKWLLQVNGIEEDQSYTVRYLPPELSEHGRSVKLYVFEEESWHEISASKAGSYLSFGAQGGAVIFAAAESESGSQLTTYALIGGGLLLLILLAALLLKKKKPVPPPETPAESGTGKAAADTDKADAPGTEEESSRVKES